MCCAYLGPAAQGRVNSSLDTLELVQRLNLPGTIVLGSSCDGKGNHTFPERHHAACKTFWYWSWEDLGRVAAATMDYFATYRADLLPYFVLDDRGGALAIENSVSCLQIPRSSCVRGDGPHVDDDVLHWCEQYHPYTSLSIAGWEYAVKVKSKCCWWWVDSIAAVQLKWSLLGPPKQAAVNGNIVAMNAHVTSLQRGRMSLNHAHLRLIDYAPWSAGTRHVIFRR